MKILSLFSGIGAFELALKRIGVNVELVGFSEIDKYAIKSYCSVHGVSEDLNLGDISEIDLDKLKELGDIDLITHGSPCQDFSIAGRLAGGDKGSGTRSSLMWCTVDIVEAVRPKYVVWENVKNLLSSKNRHNFDGYLEIMDKLGYNSYYKVLNSKHYGIPQNRERVFTVSIRKDIDSGYEFPEKIKLTKKLKDVLEESVDEKYYLSDKLIAGLIANTERQRAKGNGFTFETTDGDCVAKTITTRVGACRSGDNYIQVVGKLDIKGHDCVKRVYSGEGIAPTLTNMQGGNRQPKIIIDDTQGFDGVRVYDKYSPTLRASRSGLKTIDYDVKAAVTMRIRKLTPRECWRLMGFGDEDFNKAKAIPTSDTQLYKQAGNSIVVNVLEAVFRNLFGMG